MCIRDSPRAPPGPARKAPPARPSARFVGGFGVADSASAPTTAQNAPLGSFGHRCRGCVWARAVQTSNS
eukprot:91900-Alexandrium_andersonii.AAC.1